MCWWQHEESGRFLGYIMRLEMRQRWVRFPHQMVLFTCTRHVMKNKNTAHLTLICVLGLKFFAAFVHTAFSQLARVSTMATNSQRPKEREGILSALNVLIEASNLAKEISSATPARAVFGSFAVILTMIVVRSFLSCATASPRPTLVQESLANQQDYIELGLNCAEICKVLDRGTKGRGTEHLSLSVREAINQLTMWVGPATSGWMTDRRHSRSQNCGGDREKCYKTEPA